MLKWFLKKFQPIVGLSRDVTQTWMKTWVKYYNNKSCLPQDFIFYIDFYGSNSKAVKMYVNKTQDNKALAQKRSKKQAFVSNLVE